MGPDEEKSSDFYAVMGLKKECTQADLRNAYKKLAMKWHPDRCRASANPKYVEEAKKKFQDIQQAYSVLSDANKRFLYDVGVYDNDDDDDENGMGDFLSEMAAMMNQTKSNEKRNESFEDLQKLFQEIFHSDDFDFDSSSSSSSSCSVPSARVSTFSSSSNKKRSSSQKGGERGKRDGRKQKLSTDKDVSSSGISA